MPSKELTSTRLADEPREPAYFEGNLVVRSGYSQLTSDPELIVRVDQALGHGDSREAYRESVREDFARTIQAVRQLHNEFGIANPGYTIIDTDQVDKKGEVLTATNRIRGQYFFYEHHEGVEHGKSNLDNIPREIAVEAVSRILRYYRAVAEGSVEWFYDDLRPGNLIWGRLRGDYQDDLYLYDIQGRRFNPTVQGWGATAVRQFLSLQTSGKTFARDFYDMKYAYGGADFEALQQELDDVKELAESKWTEYLASSRS